MDKVPPYLKARHASVTGAMNHFLEHLGHHVDMGEDVAILLEAHLAASARAIAFVADKLEAKPKEVFEAQFKSVLQHYADCIGKSPGPRVVH